MKIALNKVLTSISGDWGNDDLEGNGINVIRTANFKNDGTIDFKKVVKRLFQKKTIDENGREIYVLDAEKIEEKRLLDNDIIIEKSGGGPDTPVGRVVFFENPGTDIYMANNFTQVLRADSKNIIPKYLFYYLRFLYFKGVVYKYQNQTTGLANLKLEKYLKEEILVPNFDKQNLVVTQLNVIQRNIDFRKTSIDILTNLIHSAYFQTFGDPVNNQKGFPLKKISQITIKDKIITYGIVQPGVHVEDGINIIRTGDVKKGKVNRSLRKTSKEISERFSRTICSIDDIVITIRATIGEVAKIKQEQVGYNISRELALISPNKNIIDANYLLVTLMSKGFQFKINQFIKGVAFRGISLDELRELEIPVPVNLNQQKKFSIIYEAIEDIKGKVEQSLKLLEQLFQVVLKNAFKPDIQFDEESIFKDLVKRFSVQDFRGNRQRLQYLINLFENQNFDEFQDFTSTRKILFELMEEEEIIQVFNHSQMKLTIK